jgi:hypothetical protein
MSSSQTDSQLATATESQSLKSSEPRTIDEWHRWCQQHLERIAEAESALNDKPPWMQLFDDFERKRDRLNLQRAVEIEKQRVWNDAQRFASKFGAVEFVGIAPGSKPITRLLTEIIIWCRKAGNTAHPVPAPIVEPEAAVPGATPAPVQEQDTPVPPSARQIQILETMVVHEITSERRRKKQADIVLLINRTHKPTTYARDFAALVKRGHLESREGPTGGTWIEPRHINQVKQILNSD